MYNSHLFAFAYTISNIYEQFISSDADYLNGKFALLIYVCTYVRLSYRCFPSIKKYKFSEKFSGDENTRIR